MKTDTIKKILVSVILLYAIFSVSFYFLAGDNLKYKQSASNIAMFEADSISPEIVDGLVIKQSFINKIDNIEQIALVFTKFYRDGIGSMKVELLDGSNVLHSESFKVAGIPEQHRVFLNIEDPIREVGNKELTLRISSNSEVDYGAALMMSSNEKNDGSVIRIGNRIVDGSICFSVTGTDNIPISKYYWHIMTMVGLLISLVLFRSYSNYKHNRRDYIIAAINALFKYEFLISQLVARDFKSKYKRSILGVFWSFLNPLLTMTVQFLVFSTFFNADTNNYPVYLLSGVVCFSFFNECTTMCLSSISANSRLITKVYIPKYIFPLARTISSSVNLFISLIPLILACVLLSVQIKPQAILFFYFLICLIAFSLGIGLFLSALMVFFRDIQFLWTVLIQIWMYATPIFYPAEIIPEKYKFIIRLNPLYHFIGNARTCLINGISPEPSAYIFCLLFALGSLLIGSYTFIKTQDKFALYL